MRLFAKVHRIIVRGPDETVVPRVVFIFRFVHDVPAGLLVVIPAVTAVDRPVQGTQVNVPRRVKVRPVELHTVPCQPFDGGDHRHAGAEGLHVRPPALQRVEHARLRFCCAEDPPHIAEIGVVIPIVGGVEQRALLPIDAHFRNGKTFQFFIILIVDSAKTDAVRRDLIQRQRQRRAPRVREVHHAVIQTFGIRQHIVIVRQHIPGLAAVGRIFHRDVGRKNRHHFRKVDFQRIQRIIIVKQITDVVGRIGIPGRLALPACDRFSVRDVFCFERRAEIGRTDRRRVSDPASVKVVAPDLQCLCL